VSSLRNARPKKGKGSKRNKRKRPGNPRRLSKAEAMRRMLEAQDRISKVR